MRGMPLHPRAAASGKNSAQVRTLDLVGIRSTAANAYRPPAVADLRRAAATGCLLATPVGAIAGFEGDAS